MNILCMDIRMLTPALQSLGHNILPWVPEAGGVYNLPEFLYEHNFKPDLLIQGENLGPRRLLDGLGEVNCPKIFWAIDSHLNLYWQKYYARMFDVLLTPHLSLWEALPPEERHPFVRQMARQGADIPWRPHADRPYGLSFVGVQNNQHRPLRVWLCELVGARWGLEQRQGVSFTEMLALYQQTRIVPNEAIAFEVNYRLMEAASAGAVCVTPDIGSDQNSLFEPDREVSLYSNACELMEKIEELLANPRQAESIAYAAWQRVQRSHLPVHRAKQMLELVECTRLGREPEEHHGLSRRFFFDSSLWMSRVQGARGGCAGFSGYSAAGSPPFKAFPPGEGQTCETFTMSLRLLLETSAGPTLMDAIREYFQLNLYPGDIDPAVVASFGAMRLGDVKLAWDIFARASEGKQQNKLPGALDITRNPGEGAEAGTGAKENETAGGCSQEFCLAWADFLIKAGRKIASGFLFDPKFHIPSTAMEILIFAESGLQKQPVNADKAKLLELANLTLLSNSAFAYFRLGYLARLSLVRPASWHIQFEYGMQNLLCYRMAQGLHEIFEAAQKAGQEGKMEEFRRMLRVYDKSGAIVRALELEYT